MLVLLLQVWLAGQHTGAPFVPQQAVTPAQQMQLADDPHITCPLVQRLPLFPHGQPFEFVHGETMRAALARRTPMAARKAPPNAFPSSLNALRRGRGVARVRATSSIR